MQLRDEREDLRLHVHPTFQRPEPLLHDAGIVDDSPMITMCYEAHLAMQKMLAVFAELRGDDAADTIGV
jgi:hypothetical protein